MSPLRIAMLTTFYPPYNFGGDGVGIQRLSRALAGRGHDVTVIHDEDAYLTLGGKVPEGAPKPDGVKRVGLRSRYGALSNTLTHQFGRPVVHGGKLRAMLKPGAFDIIWYHNVSLVGGPGLLAFGEGLKVYEAHEHWLVCPTHVLWRYNRELCDKRECLRCAISYRRPPQLWRYTGGLERELGHVDLFIAKSEFSRRKHKEFGFPRDMTVVPYFLPDEPLVRETGPSPHERPYFLFVGRLEKIKGLQDVFPVFNDYPDADLLILGAGEYGDELKRLAVGNPRIKFLGRRSPEELSRYYHGAIALIVPSVCFETFGIILIESFRIGTPVIARRIGPFTEIVERSKGGLLFADDAELRAAMTRLQADAAERARLAREARAGFEALWREDVVMSAYFGALADAARRRGDSFLAARLEACA